jgi:hypothetical protein
MLLTKRTPWVRPKDRDEARLRLATGNASIRRYVLEIRMLRNALADIRPHMRETPTQYDIAETLGKAAFVDALLVAELKRERASLRRWITNYDKAHGVEEAKE